MKIISSYYSKTNKGKLILFIPKEINRILDLNGINIDDFDFLNPKLN